MLSARPVCQGRDVAGENQRSRRAVTEDGVGGGVDSPLHHEVAVRKHMLDVDLDLYGECWLVLGRGRDEHVSLALAADHFEFALEGSRMGGNYEDWRQGGRTQKGQKDRQWLG